MPAHSTQPPADPRTEAALWALWRLAAPLAAVLALGGSLYRATASHPERGAMVAVAVSIVVTASLVLAIA